MTTDAKTTLSDADIPEEMFTDPPPAGEMFLPDGRPRCRMFRLGLQCYGSADQEHEHHNPESKPHPDAP